jgi:hypothetical protein
LKYLNNTLYFRALFQAELEPDGFFASGPVQPASKFVRSGPVEIRPDNLRRQSGKKSGKKIEKSPVKSVRFIFDVNPAKIRFRPVLSGPAGPEPDCRTGSNSDSKHHFLISLVKFPSL